jgi:hypothetical protein
MRRAPSSSSLSHAQSVTDDDLDELRASIWASGSSRPRMGGTSLDLYLLILFWRVVSSELVAVERKRKLNYCIASQNRMRLRQAFHKHT